MIVRATGAQNFKIAMLRENESRLAMLVYDCKIAFTNGAEGAGKMGTQGHGEKSTNYITHGFSGFELSSVF